MQNTSVKMIAGLALLGLGLWRLVGGPTATPLALLPGWLGSAAAVVALVGGFWLYRSNCGT